MFSFQKNLLFKDNVLEYTDKKDAAKRRGVKQMLTGLTKGGGGVGEILTMADKGGRGGWGNADNG